MNKDIARCVIALGVVVSLAACTPKHDGDNKLVILHTNDTHSQIVPDHNDLGGVMRRKAVIDSIRKAEDNVLLVDAGDAVQGTLYFYLYGGRVEQEVLNNLGVDVRILGNHEFDNGIDSLASVLVISDATKLSTNYDLDNTPLKGQFVSSIIKEYGDKRIGIIGINLNPDGMIAKGNYDGLVFKPIVATANMAAKKLREEDKVDAVIALSHIGYAPAGLVGDSVLAVNSRNIDVIIGGHSHDVIDPSTDTGNRRSHLRNLDDKPVLVVQTGKAGRKLGKIEIDLDKLGADVYPDYELIDIDGRYDGYSDAALEATIAKYSAGVDSLMHLWIGTTERPLDNQGVELLNFFSDYVWQRGKELAPNVDLAITNKGGLRDGLPEGKFSKGHIINMLPFRNFITVIDVKGSDLEDVFDVMARRGGDGVSANVKVKYEGGDDAEAEVIMIDGRKLDPDKIYRVATIDYLANGGDYMTGLTHGKPVAHSSDVVYDDLIKYFTVGKGKNKPLSGSLENRWTLDD